MAKFYSDSNPYGEVVNFDSGEEINILRGESVPESEEARKIQAAEYKIKQSLALQAEYDQLSEAFKVAHPDGKDYAKTTDKFLEPRIKQIIEGARDEESRLELTNQLGKFRIDAAAKARDDELQMSKRAFIGTYFEAKANLMGEAYKNPASVVGLIPEMADKISEVGKVRNWTTEEVNKEIADASKQLHTNSLLGRIATNPDEAKMILNSGVYDEMYSEKERDVFLARLGEARKFNEGLGAAVKNPEEAIARGQYITDNGMDPFALQKQGKISEVDVAIIAKLRTKEKERLRNPDYKTAVTNIKATDAILPGLTDEDSQYRMERVRAEFDSGKLNAQAIAQINLETKEMLTTRAITKMKESRYLSGDINKLTPSQLDEITRRIGRDKNAKKLTQDEAILQLRIIEQVREQVIGR